MMVNPAMIFKLKGMKDRFVANHPKFPLFLKAIQKKGLTAETIISIEVKTPDGETMTSNLKLTPEDIDSYYEIIDLVSKQNS